MFKLSAIGMRVFLFHEYDVHSVHIRQSTIAHLQAEIGSFVSQVLSEGESIMFYNGTLIYKTMMNALTALEVYGNGLLETTREGFDTLATWQIKVESCSHKTSYTTWLLPTRCGFVQCMNYFRFLSNELFLAAKTGRKEGTDNTNFDKLQLRGSSNATFTAISAQIPRNIMSKEAYLKDYREKYEFN